MPPAKPSASAVRYPLSPASPEAAERRLAMLRERLLELQDLDLQYDYYAAMPVAAWGVSTVLGCLYNGHWMKGLFWLILVAGIAAGQLLTRGQFRVLAVAAGFAGCIFGPVVLWIVGNIWARPGFAVLYYLGSFFPDDGQNVRFGRPVQVICPHFETWLAALPFFALLGVSGWCGWVLWTYIGHDREKYQTLDRIEEEKRNLSL